MKRFLSAALAAASEIAVASASDPDPVAALEGGLRAAILEKADEANPADPATGARRFVSFGFIADIHKCRRVPGDDAAKNPVTDYWYGSAGVLTEPEPSIRLLGSVAKDAGLDAVIVGGDLSTAPISGGRGFFGLVAAHLHTTKVGTITNHLDEQANPDNAVHASMVQVVNAFATNKPSRPKEHTLGTEHAYHFSLFVVDTDANKLREIRVGGRSHGVCEDPVVQLHETDIRTNARKQD